MKYKHQPARKQIDALKIEIKKDKKGKIKGFTIWADGLLGFRWISFERQR